MQIRQQNDNPLGNIRLSSLIPILFFFFALIKLKMKGDLAAATTVVLALFLSQMSAAVACGFRYGLWPTARMIVAAVLVCKIPVTTGQSDIIRASILSMTPDQRLQMLIVGLSFGAFDGGGAGDQAGRLYWLANNVDPSISCKALALICECRDGSMVIRGILAPHDAVRFGADGTVVANHGRRVKSPAIHGCRLRHCWHCIAQRHISAR